MKEKRKMEETKEKKYDQNPLRWKGRQKEEVEGGTKRNGEKRQKKRVSESITVQYCNNYSIN
jgi:hypothetical protein